ncbi:DUF3352 domain-containing protein [Phycicoccus avicenniae]|uniref:DUF3352 domain-containing protein n=1 Tax=Phycicoccus avicenniae TaxID=2828860 RepID=UPI003D29DA1B
MSSSVPPPSALPEPDGTAPDPTELPGPASGRALARGFVVGGAVAVLALGGAGAWAWAALGGGGERPADVLPGTTFAYLALDLDPAAGQKLEAVRTLSKFPGLAEAGVSEKKDLGTSLTDALLSGDPCENLVASRDITPWLGQRAAVAGVRLDDDSVPVGVVQVSDEKAAAKGLTALAACAENGDARDTSGVTPTWVLHDGWAFVAQDAATAQRVVDAAGTSTLAASTDWTRWTGEVGDQGLLTGYLAPKPAAQIRSLISSFAPEDTSAGDLEALTAGYEEFQGGALTLRFADGGLEAEAAGGLDEKSRGLLGAGAGASVAALPDDTLAAVGVSPRPGWVQAQAATMAAQAGAGSTDELYSSIEESTGLSLPEDLETLLGRTFVLSLGGDFDPGAMGEDDDPTALPLAATVTGDQAKVEDVVGRLASLDPTLGQLLGTTRAGSDAVVVGPNESYRSAVARGGRLGDSAVFRSVVPNADRAVAAFFVDVDGRDDWLASLAADEADVAKNLAPLSAIGMSAWVDGDVVHSRLRVATD